MITALRLQHFRSYHDASFEFDPGVTIIVGPNASGKTNLLEALLVVARGGSYRAADKDLVAYGQPWARLDATLPHGERTVKIELAHERAQKSFVIDEQKFLRLHLQRTLPVVLFEPEHLRLIHGSPERRREYFDSLLEETVPGFGTLKNHYRRTLLQRNNLLKKGLAYASRTIFPWNIRLGELANQVVEHRHTIIAACNEVISQIYSELAHKTSQVELVYDCLSPLENYPTRLHGELEKRLELDVLRGYTSVGPHRDDVRFLLNGKPAELSASRGETRTIMLALKLFEMQLIQKVRDQKPLLLLDDVFSELDGSRRRQLTEAITDTQVIITTTDADTVEKYYGHNNTFIALSAQEN